MDDEQLKRCPHCGGSAYLHANYSYKTRGYFVFVKCDVCGATGKAYTSPDNPAASDWANQTCDDAAAAWNLRTNDN